MPRSEDGSRRWNGDGSNPEGRREVGRHRLRFSSKAQLRLEQKFMSTRFDPWSTVTFSRMHRGMIWRPLRKRTRAGAWHCGRPAYSRVRDRASSNLRFLDQLGARAAAQTLLARQAPGYRQLCERARKRDRKSTRLK